MRTFARCAAFALCALLSNAAVSAQPSASAASGTVWVTLGTAAGPNAHVERSQPANALIVNGTPYLIDAGNGVARQVAAAKIDFRAIRAIFITHHHNDHNADMGTIASLIWAYSGRTVPVYGPPGTQELAAAFWEYFKRSNEIRMSEAPPHPTLPLFDAHDVGCERPVYQDANVTITCVENTHFRNVLPGTPAYGRDKSYSYRFQTADRTIVFTGDTGVSARVTELARGADLLVSEVADPGGVERIVQRFTNLTTDGQRTALVRHLLEEHLTPAQVGAMAATAGVKAVVLTHLTPGDDGETDDSVYSAGVKAVYHGPVTVAKDLMRF
jgi:ribonuclease BN (tRNA processing enzyme)